MFTLVHFKKSGIKGKYLTICTCTYNNKWVAYTDAREQFDQINDPNYAGFMIKAADGSTLVRQLKKEVL